MLTEDPTIDGEALRAVLQAYGIDATAIAFLPVGADGHHYRVACRGRRDLWFVSVKRTLPYGGLDVVAGGLERSYRAVSRLREARGIDFLGTAVVRRDGAYVSVVAGRPLLVQPWLDGDTRLELDAGERTLVRDRIRRLHLATRDLLPLDLPYEDFDRSFVSALRAARKRALTAGPDGSPHRRWLREAIIRSASRIDATLDHFEADRRRVLASGRDRWVVTHGEPGGHNLIWTRSGPVLIDCGGLRLAPPERDLVELGEVGEEAADHAYRRRYVLSEITEYADRLSRPHSGDAEDDRAREQLEHWLGQTDRPT